MTGMEIKSLLERQQKIFKFQPEHKIIFACNAVLLDVTLYRHSLIAITKILRILKFSFFETLSKENEFSFPIILVDEGMSEF